MTDLEQRVRGYMAACTAGDAELIASFFTPDAVHYFPPGMYGGPWVGAALIAERWAEAVRERGSSWTVDAVVVDEPRRQAVCEWTHAKAGADALPAAEAPDHTARVVLRGAEWYEFDEGGLITEIRAYYASPQADGLDRLELGGFDYAGRGYPMPG